MKVHELYEKVTNNIISEIEAGSLPSWLKPWKSGHKTGIVPINASTKAHYNGINVLMLWAEREEKGYPTAEWITYKQAQAIGGQVKKGEKSTHIIYVNRTTVGEGDDERTIPFLKCFSVFNVAQCEGLPHNEPEPELPEHERNERAEAFLSALGAEVRWGEAMAAYIPSKDCITMPARGAFLNPERLYATWAHESIHWTGHKDRLNRDLKSRFDKEAYAFEELVAEIGAAMTCTLLQVTGELRHSSYVENWLKVLKTKRRRLSRPPAWLQKPATTFASSPNQWRQRHEIRRPKRRSLRQAGHPQALQGAKGCPEAIPTYPV
jgi:antirestriction protein ArdC